jgi:transcriptional regulator with XRE-family HTH domain
MAGGTMNETPLGNFLRNEMIRLDLNQTEFAEKLHSSHPTIGRILKGETRAPDINFLVELSKLTQTDIGQIIRLIRPDAYAGPPGLDILSARLKQLPDDERQFVETILMSLAVKRKNKSGSGE